MRFALYIALLTLTLTLAGPASAFRVGIVNPTPVPADDSAALGSTMQRYDLQWRGEASYEETLVLAPDTTPIVSVYSFPVPASHANQERFCGWVGSMLARYPEVRNVIVGNEAPLAQWTDYVETLTICSPLIRSFGARVIGPGMHPSVPTSYEQPLMDAIAAAGPGLLDAWDQHLYWANLGEVITRVKSTLGIPVWVTEDGAQSRPPASFAYLYYGTPDGAWNGGLSESDQAVLESVQMRNAFCAGAAVWLTFLLRDEADLDRWSSGLERPDGSIKPAYAAFTATASAISRGVVDCSTAPPPPGRIWTPDALLAQRLGEIGAWTRDAYVRGD